MNKYDDIINLPHHVSKTRKQMSLYNRAAQFSPFAALVGHDAAIKETARSTDEKKELSEDALQILNEKLSILIQHLPYEVTITYFIPDELKMGGSYKTITEQVLKYDEVNHLLITSNDKINIFDILELDSHLF